MINKDLYNVYEQISKGQLQGRRADGATPDDAEAASRAASRARLAGPR
jgi:hypothetical protein